jgi:methyl-accepting chemotaxis protein
MGKLESGRTLNKDQIREEIQDKRNRAVKKTEEYLRSHFPNVVIRTKIITTLVFTVLVGFSFLLDSFGLAEGVEIAGDPQARVFLIWTFLVNLCLPLLILNLFIHFYLKPVAREYRSFFETRQAGEAYWKAVARFDRLNPILALLMSIVFLSSVPWGFELEYASFVAGLFYILSKLSLLLTMMILLTVCSNLFVRRRLLYTLDLYEMKTRLRFADRQFFFNAIVPLILVLNVMIIFTQVTLGIVDMDHVIEQVSAAGGDVSMLSGLSSLSVNDAAVSYIILGVFLLVQVVMIYAILSVLQRRQRKDFQSKLADLASGSGDLTRQIRILDIDDTAITISHLNLFIANLRNKLLSVEDATSRVTRSSETMFSELQNTSAAAEQMAASVQQINRTTQSRTEIIERTGNNLLGVIESLEDVKNSLDTQAAFVEQTSSSVNQMAASIRTVSESTGRANELSRHLSDTATAGGKAVDESITAVREVEDSSDEVNNLVSTISKIAAQTNLLAMNAAIEAAHAGDAGRGFAVVAEEVRNLAEDSSDKAQMITRQIDQMVGVVNNGVKMSENAGYALEEVLADISQTTDLINGIAIAMDEQNTVDREIQSSIQSLVDATTHIEEIAKKEISKNVEMRTSVNQVTMAFKEISAATEEQAEGTRDLMRIVGQLQEVAEENKEVVKVLSEAFGGFKLN